MNTAVFVYGTLLVPAIWESVTGIEGSESHAATLSGYERYRVRDAVYPGICRSPDETSRVEGRVHLEVSDEALRRLDAYEGSLYLRTPVEVTIAAAGFGPILAETYLIPSEDAPRVLTEEAWSLEHFLREAFDDFFGGAV